ncbi:MAG: hypothetical protein R3F59_19450 [Myxococcota bacterium]
MLTLLPALLGAAPAAAAPALQDEIARVLQTCSAAKYPLPAITAEQRAELDRSEVVRIVHHADDPEAPSTAVGIALLEADRNALWIAAQDPHAQVDPSLTEFVVEWLGVDDALWYGYLDLPRPIRDRQWVVSSGNNHPLARKTGDLCWEHKWTLVSDGLPRARAMVADGGIGGLTVEQLDSAVYTPVNRGAWLMAPLSDGRTLVAYQATSVVGGAIPDWLVLQLTMSRLQSVLDDLEARAQHWSPSHYTAAHAAVPGGAGEPIPRFGGAAAAAP